MIKSTRNNLYACPLSARVIYYSSLPLKVAHYTITVQIDHSTARMILAQSWRDPRLQRYRCQQVYSRNRIQSCGTVTLA